MQYEYKLDAVKVACTYEVWVNEDRLGYMVQETRTTTYSSMSIPKTETTYGLYWSDGVPVKPPYNDEQLSILAGAVAT